MSGRFGVLARGLVAVAAVAGLAACDPPAPAAVGDQQVVAGGGDLGLPSGYVRVYVSNVGTAPLVGRTTVLAEAPAGGAFRFTGAAFYPAGGPAGGDTLMATAPSITADGKQLTFHLDGTNAPGLRREVRVYFTGNSVMPPPSSYRVTFSHPDDANKANDSVAVGPNPPPPPA